MGRGRTREDIGAHAGESRSAADERFMREAISEAMAAASEGEVPIGAVVVYEGAIIARAHNRRELDEDPSAHAEFTAMLKASRALGRWRLTGCTVYVTLEPCLMCAGLMVNSRIDRCVFGASDPKAGATGSLYCVQSDPRLNHSFEVTAGVLADECAQLLTSFFERLRSNEHARDDAHAEKRDRALEEARARRVSHAAPEASASHKSPGVQAVHTLPAPRVLLALDSLNGFAASAEAEQWVAEGMQRACPHAHITVRPIAGGGAGTVSLLHRALGGKIVSTAAHDPWGEPIQASYLLGDGAGGTFAVIEVAEVAGTAGTAGGPVSVTEVAGAAGNAVSGTEVAATAGAVRPIAQPSSTHEAAIHASTHGVGELLLDALGRGAQTVYIAMGGSVTNDGGAGLLQALGAKLLDAQGNPIAPGLAGLRDATHIDLRDVRAALGSCELVALSDVDNPLVGARGALKAHGTQTGLLSGEPDDALRLTDDPFDLDTYDQWMIAYGRALDATCRAAGNGCARFRSVLGVPGAGAAGGLGAALLALGARMESGTSAMLNLVGLDESLAQADLLITSAKFTNERDIRGTVPFDAAGRAKRRHVPVIALVEGCANRFNELYQAGVDLALPIVCRSTPPDQELLSEDARETLRSAGETAIRAYLLRQW